MPSLQTRMTEPVSRRTLLLYAFPGLATALPTLPILVLLPQFYASQTAIGLAGVGIALLIARLFDMITDPLAGWLMDRFPTRWGTRKPWMLLGALLCGPGLVLLALPSPDTTLVELVALLCLLYAGWTLFTIPYNALGAELSTAPVERTRLAGAREGAVVAGITLASLLPVLFLQISIPAEDHFLLIALITLTVGAVSITALLAFLREPQRMPLTRMAPHEQTGISLSFKLNLSRPVTIILVAWFLNSLANGIGTVLFPFYLTDYLKADEQEKSLLIFIYFASAVFGLPLWLRLNRLFEKTRLWLVSILIVSVTFSVVPFLGERAIVEFGIVCLITGLCLGADLALPASLFADVTDWDHYKTKRARRGRLYAGWMLLSKLALALAAGISLPLLAGLGFETETDNSTDTLMALATLYAFGPIIIKLGILVLMARFPLSRNAVRAVRLRLTRRTMPT
ncbi:MFS transporter [Coralliovum pocilloporae]|uniref:MFS transporter n=1 Tax=Coralliovum pocilloporae TaxID=3066369 RepID=UPI0033072995